MREHPVVLRPRTGIGTNAEPPVQPSPIQQLGLIGETELFSGHQSKLGASEPLQLQRNGVIYNNKHVICKSTERPTAEGQSGQPSGRPRYDMHWRQASQGGCNAIGGWGPPPSPHDHPAEGGPGHQPAGQLMGEGGSLHNRPKEGGPGYWASQPVATDGVPSGWVGPPSAQPSITEPHDQLPRKGRPRPAK